MRTVKRLVVMGTIVGLSFGTLAAAWEGAAELRGWGRRGGPRCAQHGPGQVLALPYEELSSDELASLQFMREEEKLARDVYRTMDDRWGLRIFRNIATAEQRHMDAVLALLLKYEVADPVLDDATGALVNPELAELYGELVDLGNESIVDALRVGATIEDVDIADLLTALETADNEDVRTVYQNLLKGSRNHLRAFVSLLAANGVTYEPQYIDPLLYEEIVGSASEQGPVDADGNPACPQGSSAGPRPRWR
jgi:hypothetical protein